ncbi:hypothetical protein BDU57DRAFT_537521 [Ampelomyces quisqualis]|uniref:Uncharacterized protein n=1 Tax=Ampelomyces quisqualis TaxID=50730 RepID=A0A6A5QTG1_AMPQU|nr:hypothetical protein BDU57DRAFT_537521 [Ampelomyces quisqualis]
MHFTAQALVLFPALAITSSASISDVWSNFYDHKGEWLNSTSYRVSDIGCFSVVNASEVAFHQFTYNSRAKGPYQLRAFNKMDCVGLVEGKSDAEQTFEKVDVRSFRGDKKPNLKEGVRGATSYQWINLS